MHRDARAVQGFFNDLARPARSTIAARQRWSPVNVPLLWGAASVEETVPVLDWLVAGVTAMDTINFHDGMIGRSENRMGFFEGSDEVMRPLRAARCRRSQCPTNDGLGTHILNIPVNSELKPLTISALTIRSTNKHARLSSRPARAHG